VKESPPYNVEEVDFDHGGVGGNAVTPEMLQAIIGGRLKTKFSVKMQIIKGRAGNGSAFYLDPLPTFKGF
jgi:hypothetical protein